MIRFETVNELALKVTCQGGGVLYTKAGAFIAGESAGGKNYTFEKVLFGPQQGLLQAAFGALTRRMAGENLPLMKVNFGGDSQTYYANAGQHVTISWRAAKCCLWRQRTSSRSRATAITTCASWAWAWCRRRASRPRH